MSATILTPGKRLRGACPECGCVFEVPLVETWWDKFIQLRYARCPECATDTAVSETVTTDKHNYNQQ